MTLSISEQPTSWHRTLPRPAALLAGAMLNPNIRRSSSLIQHHVVMNQDSKKLQAENGRRKTSPCISYYEKSPGQLLQQPAATDSGSNQLDDTARLRESIDQRSNSSVMAEDLPSSSSSTSDGSQVDVPGQFCLCQPDPKIPRPRNAFILYRQHQQAAVVARNPGLPNPDISKIIGEQWRSLPAEAKTEWKALAEEEKARHQQQYPDYRYQPRRSGRYSNQSSISGSSTPHTAGSQSRCPKCGGKTMNPPVTPYTTMAPNTPGMPTLVRVPFQSRGHPMTISSQGQRQVAQTAIVSPPQSGRPRPYDEAFGQSAGQDPRLRYTNVPAPLMTPMSVGSPDIKRRRFNGNGVYVATREVYPDSAYQYSPRSTNFSRSDTAQPIPVNRAVMAPPPRAMYPLQPARTPGTASVDPRRDPNLTLPPLKTNATSRADQTPQTPLQDQKSGIEAMIMSIPVLNKIRILSQISPHLAAPSVASPQPETRGAIIAIEGIDAASVNSMTDSLAEQLEKDGKFAVRIFGGPNPYDTARESCSEGTKTDGTNSMIPTTTEEFLKMIGVWHKISKEMIEYITTKPGTEKSEYYTNTDPKPDFTSTNSQSTGIQDPVLSSALKKNPFQSSSPSNKKVRIDLTPITVPPHSSPQQSTGDDDTLDSAVSPKTITAKASQLSLGSPPIFASPLKRNVTTTSSSSPSNINSATVPAPAPAPSHLQYPRIPAAAFLNSGIPPPSTTTTPKEANQAPSTPKPKPATPPISPVAVPIALVPHYQLTTVDTSAVSLPITDAYSPLAHWQWLATLWRGCVGPDVTVVIKGTNDPDEDTIQRHRAPTEGTAAQSTVEAGVEVRLHDSRAVVVRSANAQGRKGSMVEKDGEEWEKAKRRVGFEVEEFLRR